jgi:hypothetical protein
LGKIGTPFHESDCVISFSVSAVANKEKNRLQHLCHKCYTKRQLLTAVRAAGEQFTVENRGFGLPQERLIILAR